MAYICLHSLKFWSFHWSLRQGLHPSRLGYKQGEIERITFKWCSEVAHSPTSEYMQVTVCLYFSVCGGCWRKSVTPTDLQHYSYPTQHTQSPTHIPFQIFMQFLKAVKTGHPWFMPNSILDWKLSPLQNSLSIPAPHFIFSSLVCKLFSVFCVFVLPFYFSFNKIFFS